MNLTLVSTNVLLIYPIVIIIVFFFMEFVAWFLHKYIMHGIGWFLHEDHHRYTKGRFEKNDIFGLFFSIVSFLFIFTGWLDGYDIKFAIGLGIMSYGLAYFLVHDVFFHRRVKLKYKPKSRYMKRVLHAHRIHHQKSTAYSGVCFGFVLASKKYDVN
jgi:beta-carotene 3-hydroxylase